MRRLLVPGAICALLLAAFPGAVAAAPAERTVDHTVLVQCGLETDEGFMALDVVDSSAFESFANLVFWAAPAVPFEDAPALISSDSTVDVTDTSVEATFDLVELDETVEPPFGDPAGTAALSATLTPVGDPITVDERIRDGNHWFRSEGSIQPLAVSGTLTMPGSSPIDLVACSGEIEDLKFSTTNPAAFNNRFDSAFVSCGWESADELVFFNGFADAFGSFGEVFVLDPTGEYGGGAEATLEDTAFAVSVDLSSGDDPTPVGSAEVSGTATPTGDVTRTSVPDGKGWVKIATEALTVTGTLEVSTPAGTRNYELDDEVCLAAQEQVRVHSVSPAGPKPGPLANDAPAGALPLRVGHPAKVVTGGNAAEPEATCSAVEEEGGAVVEYPITYTAWWTFIGNGADMTVDTVGSDFDTIAGIYLDEGGTLTNIACVDDVFEPDFSLQARVSVDTVAGTTYYVQAGGFAGGSGHLVVTFR